MLEDILERYEELAEEKSVLRKRKGNAFFAGMDDPRKTAIQKRRIEEELRDSIVGVCSLNLHASTEHKAHIVARQHFRSLTDEAWEYLLFWVEIITEGLDEKYEYWDRGWYEYTSISD